MSVAEVERFMEPTRCMGTAPSSSAMISDLDGERPVSYTHLTLPTILLV